jgi:hypothetical protein
VPAVPSSGIRRGRGDLPGIGAACLRSEMDRIRDGRRGGGGGGPPPPSRRRLRSNGGGGGGSRGSPRSERRRGERHMLNGGGGGLDDGDDTSDDSLGDDDEELSAPRYQPAQQRRSPSTAPPPPSPPQLHGGGHHHSSSSSGGGGYHNHHGQMQRKGGSASQKSPIVLKAADEMIGVPVPRKARSGTWTPQSSRFSASPPAVSPSWLSANLCSWFRVLRSFYEKVFARVAGSGRWKQWQRRRRRLADPAAFVTADLPGVGLDLRASSEKAGAFLSSAASITSHISSY